MTAILAAYAEMTPSTVARKFLLDYDAVHLWCVDLETLHAATDLRAPDLLDQEERVRQGRLASPDMAANFGVAHRFLRWLLSRYLGVPPVHVVYAKLASGKPVLAAGPHVALSFSLSHAGPLVAVGLTYAREIGVDVEQVGSVNRSSATNLFGLGPAFSGTETTALEKLPEDRRRIEIIRLWTLKEAVAKATGKGLSQPLSSLSFGGTANHVSQVIGPVGTWSLACHAIGRQSWLSCAVMGRVNTMQLVLPVARPAGSDSFDTIFSARELPFTCPD